MTIMSRLGLGPADRRTLGLLCLIPLVIFVVPALFGHALVTGDNQIQNLPLRALAGEDLRHGHLPLWNPYIWSGSPLLGGLNAGALYPFTWLFAVLPVVAAWTANLVVVYITTAVGMYALLRQQELRPFACGFGAASFAFAGSMSAQLVHLGIVQGVSWIPWMLLVEQRLARQVLGPPPDPDADRPSLLRRVAVLGALGGLVLLTGEPRGMADAAVVAGLAALWHLLTGRARWRARLAFLGAIVLAGVLAAGLGAVQLVPGWSFISHSQRAQSTVTFFGSGSLPVRWSLLLLVPDLMGGSGAFNQPSFFSHYNLPEITGYVGLVPLMAVAGLLARSFGSRRHRRARRWVPWFGLVVVGLVLAYGTYTPLGPFLAHLPFYGDLRLQSRNIVIADLGLCVLLAHWLDIALETPATTGARGARVLTIAPAVAVAAACVAALVAAVPFEKWMGVPPNAAHLGHAMAPWFVASLVVAAGAALVGVGYSRLAPRPRAAALAAVLAADLLLFTVSSVGSWNQSAATGGLPTTASAVTVPAGTRFAAFDPSNEYLPQFSLLGQNDLNTLVQLPSVEGYGSLTDDTYQNATGTRTHNTVSPCALAQGEFVPLGLSTLLTVGADLMQKVGVVLPPSQVPDTSCAPVAAPVSATRLWWFGQELPVGNASVSFSPAAAPERLRVGLLSPSGSTTWTPATETRVGDDLQIALATPVVGSGLVLAGAGADRATDATSVTTAAGVRYVLDGLLQAPLRDASFRFTGYRDGIAEFRTAVRDGPVTVVADAGPGSVRRPPAAALGTARRVSLTPWGQETDVVTVRRPATLVRSETFDAGWQATARSALTGQARSLPVVRVGLVQGIHLSPGTYTVTWTYQPGSVKAGLVASAVGAVAVAGAGLSWLRSARRRRRRGPALSRPARRRGATASSRAATRG